MLQSLDLIIAFAVIMSVVSLLITVIVQMVSSALALRGKNMANALSLAFQTIDPRIGHQAHALAAYILRSPVLSDSIWAPKSQNSSADAQVKEREAQQLLTAAQEALRNAPDDEEAKRKEREARQAVKEAQAAATAAREREGNLAGAASTDNRPWRFWDTGWKALQMANAIRPGEVYRVLHDISEMDSNQRQACGIPEVIAETANKLLESLDVPDGVARESQAKIEAVVKIANMFSTSEQQEAVISSLQGFGATVDRAASHAYDRFQRWFGSAQDRAEQWFLVHVRVITITASILAALLLQLDTAEILRKLRSNPAMVEALVKSAPAVKEEGERVLDPTNTPAFHTYLLWLKVHPEYPLEKVPENGTHETFREAIKQKLGADPNTTALLAEYDRLQVEGTKKFQELHQQTYANLGKKLEEAGFELVPTRFMGRWASEESASRRAWQVYGSHLLGMGMTAALLSLGAPFWFNLLKNLMNLRPAVATLVERRPQSSPALPQLPPTATPS